MMGQVSSSDIKYSILIAGGTWSYEDVLTLLNDGKKVIWFCNQRIESTDEIQVFCESGFARILDNANGIELTIIDGINIEDNMSILEKLEKGDPRFNLEQYVIEHSDHMHNLIVEAGAGTGKTHVMIDRIMYLMHVDENFDFSKVAMITFTNKATDNMRHRLVKTLDSKYKLTGDVRYLDRIEELSRISISTIHAFFKKVIVEVGPTLGYGTNIQLKSYIYEKRELLRDLLDKQYRGRQRVRDVIGLDVHKIEELALQYWEKLDNNGLSEDEISSLQWGSAADESAAKIQKSLKDIFMEVDEKYNEIKYMNNAISMKDIIHELSRVIYRPELKDYISQNYSYMFCDEFQDSDNVQIQTIAILNRIYDGNLFVVGDVKQSIYRFRGATDSAFNKLKDMLNDSEKKRLIIKTLTKNYRTSDDILKEFDDIFCTWGKGNLGLLQYEDSEEKSDKLIPQIYENGVYKQIRISEEDREKQVIEAVRKVLAQEDHNKVTFLARKNSQLRTIKGWCEKEKIVCLIREKGSFYESDAVLDFCALIEAYLYDNEPMYLYNYILSSYGSAKVDYDSLSKCEGDKGKIFGVLLSQIDINKWDTNRKNLRNRPVISVLREMIEDINPVRNYGIRRRGELTQKNYPLDKAIDQAVIDTIQYEANLKKLLQLLTDQFSGDFSSLLDICGYVRNRIMTDREEEPADIDIVNDIDYVEGYTVHSAKGLEFDNVFIPYMNDPFFQTFRSEILVSRDRSKVGWVYRERGKEDVKNDQYDQLIVEERDEVAKEETRLLYVAMTRAIYGLYCFVERKSTRRGTPSSWTELLPEEKDNA